MRAIIECRFDERRLKLAPWVQQSLHLANRNAASAAGVGLVCEARSVPRVAQPFATPHQKGPAFFACPVAQRPTEFRGSGAGMSVAHSRGAGALPRGVARRASSSWHLVCSGVPRLKPNFSHFWLWAIHGFLESSGPKQPPRSGAETAATATMLVSRMEISRLVSHRELPRSVRVPRQLRNGDRYARSVVRS
jgi:hypothetical protein